MINEGAALRRKARTDCRYGGTGIWESGSKGKVGLIVRRNGHEYGLVAVRVSGNEGKWQ